MACLPRDEDAQHPALEFEECVAQFREGLSAAALRRPPAGVENWQVSAAEPVPPAIHCPLQTTMESGSWRALYKMYPRVCHSLPHL